MEQINLTGHLRPHNRALVAPAARDEVNKCCAEALAVRGLGPRPRVVSVRRSELSRFKK
jgi:hypothetical protein